MGFPSTKEGEGVQVSGVNWTLVHWSYVERKRSVVLAYTVFGLTGHKFNVLSDAWGGLAEFLVAYK